MADKRIGISLDVRNGNGVERILRNFDDVAKSAEEIQRQFDQVDKTLSGMSRRGWGSENQTRELQKQLQILRDMTRLTQSNASRAGNEDVRRQMGQMQQRINSSMTEANSLGSRYTWSDMARMGGNAAMTYAGYRALSTLRQGYNANLSMLPEFASFGQTMGYGSMGSIQGLLGSGQGFGYSNPQIMAAAQILQQATGRTSNFNVQMRALAGFGRSNGFDYGQAANYFAQNYQSGGNLSPLQYATLVAQTVNAGNMQGRNAQVADALTQLTQMSSAMSLNANTQSVSQLYATGARTGNQAFINQLPSIMGSVNSAISSGGNLGPMGQAAMWQALAPGMNYWDAQMTMSGGAFASQKSMLGHGSSNTNFQNMMTYAYRNFGGNSTQADVMLSQWLGINPAQARQLMNTYMQGGHWNQAAFSKNEKSLQAQIQSGGMTPLDNTLQNTVNPSQQAQRLTSGLVGPISGVENALFGNPVGLLASGAMGAVGAHGILKGVSKGVTRGRPGILRGLGKGGSFLSRLLPFGAAAGADVGIAGGLEAAGAGLDATGVGAIAGIPLNIIGAVLAAGGIGATVSHLFGGKSVSKSSSAPSVSGGSDIQAEAQNVISVLMILRPWAQQIGQWFGASGASSGGNSSVGQAQASYLKNASTFNAQLYSQVAGQSASGTGLTLSGPSLPPKQNYTGSGEKQFIQTMKPYALQTAAQMGVPAQYRDNVAQMLLSEWGDESGWGSSLAAKKNDNFGGIKPPGSGHLAGADNTYAGYTSLSDWANGDAYFFTHNSNYSKFVQAAKSGASPQQLANLLGQTGYAQNPSYASSIIGNLPSVQSLYGSAPATTVKVSAPKSITIQLQDPNGNIVGSKMVQLTTTATMNGQK